MRCEMAEENTKTRKVRTAAKIISFVLILLLLFGIIGIIFVFTNGGNEDFKTFYLVYDGKNILTSEIRMDFEVGRLHRFDVKYTFDIGEQAEPREYNVKIIANTDVGFNYMVDGVPQNWKGEKEITKAFELAKEPTYFTLNLPAEFTTKDALQNLYSDKDVQIDPAMAETLQSKYLYTLVVSSYNEAVTYYIDFRLPIGELVDTELNFSHLVF